jgi:hypothetical protein
MYIFMTTSVVYWSELLAADSEVVIAGATKFSEK